MNIGIANAAEVDAVWPSISEPLQVMLDKAGGDISSGYLWQLCRSGNGFLVVATTEDRLAMAGVFQFQSWSCGPVLRCLGVVGKGLEEWGPEAFEYVAKMAEQGGARAVVFCGREGLARTVPGTKRLTSTFMMEI